MIEDGPDGVVFGVGRGVAVPGETPAASVVALMVATAVADAYGRRSRGGTYLQ